MQLEWWIVFATLAGPVLAVQAQKAVERGTERRRRRLMLFSNLMANRATRLAGDFVRSLNLIELEFLPRRPHRTKDQGVIDAWRALLGDLNHGPAINAEPAVKQAFDQRCDDRVVELLRAMSTALGFAFTSEELRRGIYRPQGHAEQEQAHLAVLDGLRKVFTGQASVPMAVTHFPGDPDISKAQLDLARKAAGAYDEEHGALRVKQIK